jgi:hypothetical protein
MSAFFEVRQFQHRLYRFFNRGHVGYVEFSAKLGLWGAANEADRMRAATKLAAPNCR